MEHLCKNCIHFVPPPKQLFKKQNLKKGKCSLFAKIGEMEFENAEKAREELCKGKFFKEEEL